MTDAWDGQPKMPDRGLAHCLENYGGTVQFVALWCEQDQMWAFPDGTMHGPSGITHLHYLGPCLTPAEVAARVAAAVMAEREAALSAGRTMQEQRDAAIARAEAAEAALNAYAGRAEVRPAPVDDPRLDAAPTCATCRRFHRRKTPPTAMGVCIISKHQVPTHAGAFCVLHDAALGEPAA